MPRERSLEFDGGQDVSRSPGEYSRKDRTGYERDKRDSERRSRRSRSRERRRSRSKEREDKGRDREEKGRSKRSRSRSRSRDRKDHKRERKEDERDRKRVREEGEIRDRDDSDDDRKPAKEENVDAAMKLAGSVKEEVVDVKPTPGRKPEPLSLEEILKKKKEDALLQAKPVFLTKAQREALALKRLEERAAEQKKRNEEQRKLIFGPSSENKDSDDKNKEREREREQERERERDRERERERDRGKDRDDRRDRDRDRGRDRGGDDRERGGERKGLTTKEMEERKAQREREKELEAIKDQYLGVKKVKKRVVKPSEKFRFSFDWENTEDTSRDMNPIYQNPHEAQLLFGRGFRAGVDRREQKKLAAKNEAELRNQLRIKDGVEENPEEAEERRQKAAAANTYDTFDMRVDRHWSEKKLEEMTDRDWRIFREDFNIAYKGTRLPRPMRNWSESLLNKELLAAVEKAGYKKPSPIQMAAIPLGLQQRDVIGIAETGSGKTAAFVLPMLTYISKLPPMTEYNEAEGPYAVVMAPTRELAQQIEEETNKFAYFLNLRVVSIVGGQSIEEQGFKLRQGCEIVIATPGRLLDCLERRYAVLNQCNYVVLDEADRMIDMGFEPQVIGVLDAMPSSNLKPENEDEELDVKKIYRTTYMFSATMPSAVERLARKYLRNPVVVTIGQAGKATDLITQTVIMMKETEKKDRLQRMLDGLGDKTAIVFVNTKKSADGLAKQLDKMGYKSTVLHGGKTQEQREVSLEGFRAKRYNVLVATDVAGRGIDIPDVAHVINYDMPSNIENYTHRIGRTGRAGKTGTATSFITAGDSDTFYDLKQMLIQSNSPVPPELARHEASKFKPGSIPDRPRLRDDKVYAKH
eukprot:TRINITY_DN22260_c0_g1_i1.p1 TRINITY_DN22260_c0_g1~~TRINITY_DN22260_c0_g1_i1.p1  ORF type:complete len:868 (-),score=265.39 TRINITY_DN22260_c0_g1_i1:504-3107(-)